MPTVNVATGVIVFDVDTKLGPLEATESHSYLEEILGIGANHVHEHNSYCLFCIVSSTGHWVQWTPVDSKC